MTNRSGKWAHAFLGMMIVFLLVSCKKDNQRGEVPAIPKTGMEYFNLNNAEIKAGTPGLSLDVNHDGRNDLAFHTQLVGDPLYQVDKIQFLVVSNVAVNLPVNGNEEVPVLNSGDAIRLEDFNGYHWYEISSILLVQKVVSFNAPPVWNGHWRNASHKFLPYQVVANGKRYNGWVEVSIDVAGEKVVIHKAAVSKEEDKVVRAGE